MDQSPLLKTSGAPGRPEEGADSPLVTFALFAYNQESYVREAVEAAFAQTYEPLEIILSDDCSSDRTFEIMQEMAAAYRGPHRVVLNRNSSNLGIGAHVSKVFDLARGTLIVMAAGDDVSAPNRTSRLAEKAEEQPDAMAFFSAYRVLQSEIGVKPDLPSSIAELLSGKKGVLGATAAYRAVLHNRFKTMFPDVRNEDAVYALRALLHGRIVAIEDEELVHYRADVGVSAIYRYNPRRFNKLSLSELKYRTSLVRQWRRDLTEAGAKNIGVELYGFRVSNAFLISLHKQNGSRFKLGRLYSKEFGNKAALYYFIGYQFPSLLNIYLSLRHRSFKSGII
jgi:glycosyltransferase involved in cell wall biosynthesis